MRFVFKTSYAQDLGCLLKGEPVEVVEGDHVAVLRRQRRDAGPDRLAQFLVLRPLVRAAGLVTERVGDDVVHHAGRQAAPTKARVAQVQRNAVEPGQRGSIHPQLRPMPVGPHERVLQDLFSQASVAGQRIGRPEHVGMESFVQGLEARKVSCLDRLGQILLSSGTRADGRL